MLNSIPENLDQCTFDFDALNAQPYESPKLHLIQASPRKRCSKCKKVKDLDQFSKRAGGKQYRSWCKQCRNDRYSEKTLLRKKVRAQEFLDSLSPEERELRKTHKPCTKCGDWLPFSEFFAGHKTPDGLHYWCPKCCSESQTRHRTLERNREGKLRYIYGITPEQYDQMLEEQNGVCAVCKMPETQISAKTGKVQPLSIDHNHDTGQVRALLCSACNTAYGHLREDESIILALLAYHQKWHPEP